MIIDGVTTGGGWSWDETRSPTAGHVALTVGGLSVRAPTNTVLSCDSPRQPHVCSWSLDFRPNDAYNRLQPSRLRPNSIAYKQYRIINALTALHY